MAQTGWVLRVSTMRARVPSRRRRRRSRDAGHQLDEVEGDALAGQQTGEAAVNFGSGGPAMKRLALAGEPLHRGGARGERERSLKEHPAAEHDAVGFLDGDAGASGLGRFDGRGSGDIALADVLGQGALDEFSQVDLPQNFHGCSSVRLFELLKLLS